MYIFTLPSYTKFCYVWAYQIIFSSQHYLGIISNDVIDGIVVVMIFLDDAELLFVAKMSVITSCI